jgi:hypothetical protein
MKIKGKIVGWYDWRIHVFVIWTILTGFNITKAYHIDDTFHLLAAEHIQNQPLSPMSGLINWDKGVAPGYQYNQPPLFFYLIAATDYFAGNSEFIMHLMLSVFTFLSLFYFGKLTELLQIKSSNSLLLLFGFSPAFIINQNLMTDIPVLTVYMSVIYFLIKAQEEKKNRYYIIASFLIAIGLLIKYTTAPLIIVLLLTVVSAGEYKKASVILIPITVLFCWSLWNLHEYGSMHIFSRPKNTFDIKKPISFLGTLGAVSTYTILFIREYLSGKKLMFLLIFTGIIVASGILYLYFFRTVSIDLVISIIFICNGFILTFALYKKIVSLILSERIQFSKNPYFIILICILGLSAFIIFFAPFNATRHLLLVIPFLLLFGEKYFFQQFSILRKAVVYLTILIGVSLGISDWLYADFYRKSAKQIASYGQTAWSLGHWGWQWYSEKAGMHVYSPGDELKIKKGDLLVYPANVPRQNFVSQLKVDTVKMIIQKASYLTFFSVKNGSMYNSFISKPVWTFSCNPTDTIVICRFK